MSNGVKVSITKMMTASAPAMKGEAGQLVSAKGGEVRVHHYCAPFASLRQC